MLVISMRRLESGWRSTLGYSGSGSPIFRIAEEAKALKADYIVIGSHGHGAFYDLLVGSTTSGVLKKASCAVVVVPVPRSKKAGKARRK